MLAQCLGTGQLAAARCRQRDSDIASGPRYLVGLAELAAWLYPDASVPSGKRIHEEWANAAWMPMYKENDGGQD